MASGLEQTGITEWQWDCVRKPQRGGVEWSGGLRVDRGGRAERPRERRVAKSTPSGWEGTEQRKERCAYRRERAGDQDHVG